MEPQQYIIYVNGFWSGFLEKTDANHIGFFETIFKNAFNPHSVEFTTDLNKANVLFESVFSNSLVNAKKWLHKIQYSGEPRLNPTSNYDLTLFSENDGNKIINLPLFVYYIHGNNLLDRLIHRRRRTIIPPRFCCFIVSNGRCSARNKMFDMLNQYKKVDSCGNFKNNVGAILPYDYWSPEFTGFISNYKFIICFENTKFGTYSTEKIVNSYLANVIPIYWSSHSIKHTFNPNSMLFLEDEREESYNKLITQIIELDNDNNKYLEYVNRQVVDQTEHWNANYTIDVISKKISEALEIRAPEEDCSDSRGDSTQEIRFFITHYTPLIDRRAHMINELDNAGILNYEFIVSKDREELTPKELSKFNNITKSEISLFLKHVEIFKNAPENSVIVVFEDDSVLCPNFWENLNHCLRELKSEKWDVLFSGECCNLHTEITAGKRVYNTGFSRGACMYVLNVGAGKKLYEAFLKYNVIDIPIDWWFNKIRESLNECDFQYYWSEPTLVSQGSEIGKFQSSLRGSL